ncbi:hypothetical protein V8E53_015123 [Lactarius tabidus]
MQSANPSSYILYKVADPFLHVVARGGPYPPMASTIVHHAAPRRNTTGSAPPPPRTTARVASYLDLTSDDGELSEKLISDIQQQAEQIRRERLPKLVKKAEVPRSSRQLD